MRAALQKAGFDFHRFDDLKRRNGAAMREALAKARAAGDERAPAIRDTLASSTENWLRANNVVGDALPPSTGVYALSTADRISADGFEFLSQNTAPWANSAQVILERTTGDDVDTFDGFVTFTFSWENQTGVGNLFNVTALLGVTASGIVTADSYWWPLEPTKPASLLEVYGRLWITEIVDGHVIVPPTQSSQSQEIMSVQVDGAWGVGTIAGQDRSNAYVLQYLNLFVPANGRIEIQVHCEVYWLALDGGGYFIASGNGRQVTGPGVIISTAPWNIS